MDTKENVLGFFKKHKNILTVLIAVLIMIAFFFAWYKLFLNIPVNTHRIEYALNTAPDGIIDTLLPDTVVQQNIEPDLDYDSFSLYFAKDRVTKGCDVTVLFCDANSGEELQSWTVSSDDLADRGYTDFNLNDKMEAEKLYSIKIYSENSGENNTVSVVTSSTVPQIVNRSYYPLKEMFINGESQGNICIFLKLNSSNISSYKAIYLFIAILFTVLISFLCYFALTKRFKIETVFLVCCLAVGCVYMCIMTPNSVPDEPVHYFSAYKYSNAMTFNSDSSLGDSLLNMSNKDTKVLSYSITPTLQTYGKVSENIFAASEDNTQVEVPSVTAGNVLQYLPAAIGLSIGRVLNFNGLFTYYMGRLFNLIFFALMTYFAIKKLPFGKMVLFVISLFPITMQQAASYSYDAVINGLAFFAIGYSFYLAYTKDKIRVREIVALSVVCALLSASKAGVYLPIGALCFLVFARRKSLPKKKLIACIGAVLGSSVMLLLIFNIQKILNAVLPGSSGADVTVSGDKTFYSTSFILTNTKDFIRMFFATLRQMKDYYYTTMVGGQLGWLNVFVGELIIALFFVTLIIAALKKDDEEVYFNFKSRALMLIISGVIMGEILIAALTWTDINSPVILGFQGRYLIPVLPLIAYCLRGSGIVIKKDIGHKLALITVILQCITVLEIFTDRIL